MDNSFKKWVDSIPRAEARLCPATCWEPAADIYETDDGWLIKFDLSGVRPEDLHVRVSGRRITVAGERRDYAQQSGARYYRMEISYSGFQRSIELPGDIDAERVSSEFQNGMLLVQAPERSSK